jgi:hypothetical protein
LVGDAEDGESGEVDGGGEELEVGGDFDGAAHPGAASAVASAHEVADFAFDFRSGGPVVGFPYRVGLDGSGGGQSGFVASDRDDPA